MGLRDRIARAGMFPNMGEIRGELDQKFSELVTELRALRNEVVLVQQAIREVGTRKEPPA